MREKKTYEFTDPQFRPIINHTSYPHISYAHIAYIQMQRHTTMPRKKKGRNIQNIKRTINRGKNNKASRAKSRVESCSIGALFNNNCTLGEKKIQKHGEKITRFSSPDQWVFGNFCRHPLPFECEFFFSFFSSS